MSKISKIYEFETIDAHEKIAYETIEAKCIEAAEQELERRHSVYHALLSYELNRRFERDEIKRRALESEKYAKEIATLYEQERSLEIVLKVLEAINKGFGVRVLIEKQKIQISSTLDLDFELSESPVRKEE